MDGYEAQVLVWQSKEVVLGYINPKNVEYGNFLYHGKLIQG